MRLIPYLKPQDRDKLMAHIFFLSKDAAKFSFLKEVRVEPNFPEDYISTCLEKVVDYATASEDDLLLIDPIVYPRYALTTTYALYCKHFPVLLKTSGREHELLRPHNLLYIVEDLEEILRFMESFRNNGLLITLEGGDGAGKKTEVQLLVNDLRKAGHNVETIDFPKDEALLGKMIRKILRGDYGPLDKINPSFFSFLYSVNRHAFGSVLRFWIRRGYIIIADRYVESNFAHQVSKLAGDVPREKLIQDLCFIEYQLLDLPKSHLVLFLDLPPFVRSTSDGARSKSNGVRPT